MEDPRTYMRIYQRIRDRIEAGELADGDRLDIGLIAAEWHVNRSTVTKAMEQLGAAGYAVRFPGLGWYAKAPVTGE
jgi:DNA-binding GntR family transcriptional regulator